MINLDNALLVLIDFQEKLVKIAKEDTDFILNAKRLLKTCDILNIPILITEQYPQGLGSTIDEIKNLSINAKILEKTTFSAYSTDDIKNYIDASGKIDIILCGIETHICALQTALELSENNYNVYFVQDACVSRSVKNFNNAIQRLSATKVVVTDTEMTIFELLKSSKHEHFKEIQKLIK